MIATATSFWITGIDARRIDVEAHVESGTAPGFAVVGLADRAVQEARQRVRSGIKSASYRFPPERVTVNLAPARERKQGSGFDLAIALAILAASGQVEAAAVGRVGAAAELGLDGRLRPIQGTIAIAEAAGRHGLEGLLVAPENAAEASLAEAVAVLPAYDLYEAVQILAGQADPTPVPAATPDPPPAGPDLRDVCGQPAARRALEVAAAGHHNLLMVGPPGSGKTMLAERLPGLLPPLDRASALEVTAVHSVAGMLDDGSGPLVDRAPYQAPHHTASVAAIVGGGSTQVRPGAASLAHRGVLFMDEAPEFAPAVLDALREPLESGEITVARLAARVRFPARFQLVLAANPCPCAAPAGEAECRCTATARRRYIGRISGPLLDRMDLQVQLHPVVPGELLAGLDTAEPSAAVASRVAAARAVAAERLRGTGWRINADVPGPALRSRWRLPAKVTAAVDVRLDRGELSARGYDRVLRVAWSVSDLAGQTRPTATDVEEAVALRSHWTTR